MTIFAPDRRRLAACLPSKLQKDARAPLPRHTLFPTVWKGIKLIRS